MLNNLLPIAGMVCILVSILWMLKPVKSQVISEPAPTKRNIHEMLAEIIEQAPNAKSASLLRQAGQAFYEVDDGSQS